MAGNGLKTSYYALYLRERVNHSFLDVTLIETCIALNIAEYIEHHCDTDSMSACRFYAKYLKDRAKDECRGVTSILSEVAWDLVFCIEKHCNEGHAIKKQNDLKNSWILCSDHLPETRENVIVSVVDDSADTLYKYVTCAWLYDCGDHVVWISENDVVQGSVVAWMPLPDPYKEKKDE